MCAFVIYDKFLKKEEKELCTKTDCQCEKDDDYVYEYGMDGLESKYINIADKNSYISFDVYNRKWEAYSNECEGYGISSGSFSVEKNIISLESDLWGSSNIVKLYMESGDSYSRVLLIREMNDESSMLSGCSGSPYFIAEKK